MRENRLGRVDVVFMAQGAGSVAHSHDQRHRHLVFVAPAYACRMTVNLVNGRIRESRKHDFGHNAAAGQAHTDGRSDDADFA